MSGSRALRYVVVLALAAVAVLGIIPTPFSVIYDVLAALAVLLYVGRRIERRNVGAAGPRSAGIGGSHSDEPGVVPADVFMPARSAQGGG
jgi:hypothetical protein